MTDTEAITPALTREEWERFTSHVSMSDLGGMPAAIACLLARGNDAGVIALTNLFLPDSDPRKLTREHARRLRATAAFQWEDDGLRTALTSLANALDSLLPPEDTRG